VIGFGPKADMQHIILVAGKQSFDLTVRAAICNSGADK
jgi:hypothetical protein